MKKMFPLLLVCCSAMAQVPEDCPPPPAGTQYSPCPQAPPGFCPYVEAFALAAYSEQVPARIYYPPGADGQPILTAVRIEFEMRQDREYEIQFTRNLFASPVQWIAYARFKACCFDIVLTDCPIYPCDPQRFFRVMVKPLPVMKKKSVTLPSDF